MSNSPEYLPLLTPPENFPALRVLQLTSPLSLRASGADVDSFLQGQLTGDLRQLTSDQAIWSAYCSPKGRMLAAPLLLRNGADVELWLPQNLLEPVLKRLRMFVLRAKVQLEAPASTSMSLSIDGHQAADWIAAQAWPVPAHVLQVSTAPGLRIVRLPGITPRFLAIGAATASVALPQDSLLGGEAALLAWREADIRAGVPRVDLDTQDRWVPQMANLDLLGGISFDKGCYTGQEVVARLHYLGNLKKRLFLLQGAGEAPQPGGTIRDSAGQSAGDVVDAVALPGGAGFVASAVMQLSALDTDLFLEGAPPRALLQRPVAYAYGGDRARY